MTIGEGEDKALDGGDVLVLDIVDQVPTGMMSCGANAGCGAGIMDGDGAVGSIDCVAIAGVFVSVEDEFASFLLEDGEERVTIAQSASRESVVSVSVE